MNFLEKWTSIVDELKANAADLGVSANKIDFGKYGEKPSSPPFILVYMEPAQGQRLENSKQLNTKATVTIACGVNASKEQHKAVSEAVGLAHLASDCVESLNGISGIGKPEVDGVYNGSAVALIEFIALYEKPKLGA